MAFGKILTTSAGVIAMAMSSFSPVAAASNQHQADVLSPGGDATALTDLIWSAEQDVASGWRGYRGYRGYRHRHNGIDGGDVLAGALILGGIAAIASAASRDTRRPRVDERQTYYEPRTNSNYRSGDLNAAADQCAFAAEDRAGSGARIDRITTVARDGNGWRVEGSVESERGYDNFYCGITDGRIDYIQLADRP